MANNEPGKALRVKKPMALLAACLLCLLTAAGSWVYVQARNALHYQAKAQGVRIYLEGAQASKTPGAAPEKPGTRAAQADPEEAIASLLRDLEEWIMKGTLATAAGGTGLTLAALLGLGLLRRSWMRRLVLTRHEWEETCRRLTETTSALQVELTERQLLDNKLRQLQSTLDQRVEDHVRERTATLSRTYEALAAELNSRKQAERALTQQAQELGRSKDVLELHVQARTQELQKLQRRYEHILNSAGEGIYGLDLQGRTTFVNPAAAKLTGWKVEELINKSEGDVFQRHGATGGPAGPTQFLNRSGEHLGEEVFVRKDGTTFPVEAVRTPILEKEKVVGAVVIFKDITERKRTEETLARKAAELARSNAELEQFAYVASHDLQEPLRKIQAFGDRLKSKCDAAQLQDGRDYLERMQSAAARMQTLINDLLTFSRVISATQPFVSVDLGAVTKEVLTDLEVRIEQTRAKVEVGELPTIEADPLQMRQLLQNLVGNALKFQAPNSQPLIKIQAKTIKTAFADGPEATPSDELCELTVEDNGIGFDEKYLEKIFAMFQRLHGRSEYEGTGVGLAVCRRITDRHGGIITARSKPGEGATFIVTLPIRQQMKELKAAA